MREFKIRCSAIGTLMSGSIYPTLTKPLEDIYAKVESGKELTELQQKAKDKYENALANPELPQGVKTYLKAWHKEQRYDKRKEFTSKYTDKGNMVENDAIDLIADCLGYPYLQKYEGGNLSNEYITGTPDVVISNKVIDNKSSWDCFTFPLYDDKPDTKYWWQGQGYMILTGVKEYILAYTLMDMPESILIKACYGEMKARGLDEIDADLYLEVKAKHTYSHLPNDMRIKAYFFPFEASAEEMIIERVKLARKYIASLETNNIIKMSSKEVVLEKLPLSSLNKRAAAA